MNEKESFVFLGIGRDTGMYLLASMLLDGLEPTPMVLEAIKRTCAESIEKAAGMPAEDFALKMQPNVELLLKGLKDAMR